MTNVEHLAPPPRRVDDPFAEIAANFRKEALAAIQSFKDEPPTYPPYERPRHPFLYPDFYCFIASLSCALLITSSLIDRYLFEPLVYGVISFQIIGLLLLLSRNLPLNVRGFDPIPHSSRPRKSLRQRQLEHGITPIDYDLEQCE